MATKSEIDGKNKAARPFPSGLMATKSEIDRKNKAAPPFPSGLNPMARAWHPFTDRSPQEQRMLFMTFSKGRPLTRPEVTSYFARKFGEGCVEDVYVHKRRNRKTTFAVVRFNACYIPVAVLHENDGDGKRARHEIRGRAVEFKKYDVSLRNPLTLRPQFPSWYVWSPNTMPWY